MVIGKMRTEGLTAHRRSSFQEGGNNGIMNKDRMNRARNIRSVDDLNKVTNSTVVGMESYGDIQNYFSDAYGISVLGFDNCDLFAVMATMAGLDDILVEFPDAADKISTVRYVPQLKAMGDIDRDGRVRIGKDGLRDYGTGVHEAVHALDYKRSKPGTNSFSADIVAEARKVLGLRKNSKEYNSLAFVLTNSIRDAGDSAELFAYAVESEMGGASNKLSSAIYAQLKGAKQ